MNNECVNKYILYIGNSLNYIYIQREKERKRYMNRREKKTERKIGSLFVSQ